MAASAFALSCHPVKMDNCPISFTSPYFLISFVGETVDGFARTIRDEVVEMVPTKDFIIDEKDVLLVTEASKIEVRTVSITTTPIPSKTWTLVPTKTSIPTIKASPTRTLMSTKTKISTKTVSSCPGAPVQQLLIEEDAKVCTKNEKVALRSGPSKNDTILVRVKSGTIVWVLDGPACANNWSWWKVKLTDGTSGWMSEGGDSVDSYFLCPN